ncbi:MAG: 30S ribosomal protein S12 methylthiotransferase RimO [Bacteroidetes bacterium]|nr:30S ribosomal protein S12 methylthiotransferase RimO [Bacteroidota bacterium]
MKRSATEKSVYILTLGCAKNLVDSEFLMGKLTSAGFRVLYNQSSPKADVAIINTCGFIGDAKEESIDTILGFLQAKKQGKFRKVFVMGCLSQRYREELKLELPEVDGFFGVNEQKALLHHLVPDLKKELTGERWITTPGHYAYIKISEGCDRLCSFCAIPSIRGRQVSVPIEHLVMEAKSLIMRGVKEINLIAQDTTMYGTDLYGRRKLPALLKALASIDKLEWIRLHYAYPRGFPEGVLDVMREHPNICNYLDIPLQHINTGILRSMKRGTARETILALLEKMRTAVPGISLRTTFIVGYPGEGDKEFRELYDFVEAQRFDRMGAFTYSPEEGTPAWKLGDPVPDKVKQQRMAALMDLQMNISREINETRVGRSFKVLIDREEESYFVGRTEFDSPEVDNEVLVDKGSKSIKPGEFYNCLVTGAEEFDLHAEAVGIS